MINVVATLVTNPGERAFVLEAFQEMRPLVLKEAGCIEYQPVIDTAGATPALGVDTFMVIEKWRSLDDLKAHNEGAALSGFLSKVKARLASVIVQVLEPV